MNVYLVIGISFIAGFILRMILDYKALKKAKRKIKYVDFTNRGFYVQGVGDGYLARKEKGYKTEVRRENKR